ncbi:LysM peptidoglycan-binding domain-containing protein [Acidihalobacter aeolianus]|uniref:LysM peptidoglycan-binding domain-containing protein n=1 Tax=Acidihalobacter aeolianus TaxID=2792603 RepID=UPI0009F5E662|nr:LysM peptidoglycan-binding domain-containing protein [Acidihalobacter aeolianus]
MSNLRKTQLIKGLPALAALFSLTGCATLDRLGDTGPQATGLTTSSAASDTAPCTTGSNGTSPACQTLSAVSATDDNSSIAAPATSQTVMTGNAANSGASPSAPPGTGNTATMTPASSTSAVQPAQNETIWTDIRDGFKLPDNLDQPLVQQAIAFYRQHPAYLERVTARAEPYLYYILQQIHQRHMPTELALLPVVESAYIPYAYSSCQAAGIWQFTPSTGRHFGLKQNWWYDGRRDIYASTKAALDYLQSLHDQFGSWLLALAAYNSGAGTVQWAIKRNQERHQPTDFWALDLPEQTKTYVPKLLAVKAIVEHPRQFNVSLWPIPDKPYLAVVHLKSQIDLALAAKLAGIKLNELYLLNPGYNRWATDPNGPHRLLLPADSVQGFEEKLASIPASERVTWIRHRVRAGDTLGQIADEYHTSIRVIRQTNHLNGNIIRIGQYLIVPKSSRPYAEYAMAEGLRHRMPQTAHRGEKLYHTVKAGDTLWDIAQANGVSVENLARWNNLSARSPLRLGQRLVIWSGARKSVHSRTERLASINQQTQLSVAGTDYHIVKPGDTLWGIAESDNISVAELLRWNHLSPHTALHPGQRLIIHQTNGSGLALASSGQPTQRVRVLSYVVRNGDSLYSIAQKFGVNIPAIRKWNDLWDTNVLHPGQPLKLRVDVTQMHNES